MTHPEESKPTCSRCNGKGHHVSEHTTNPPGGHVRCEECPDPFDVTPGVDPYNGKWVAPIGSYKDKAAAFDAGRRCGMELGRRWLEAVARPEPSKPVKRCPYCQSPEPYNVIGMHNCIHRDCADCGGHHNPLIACPESGKPGYGIHESDDPGENKSAITTESGLPAEPESGIGGGGERGVSSGTPSGKPGSESPQPVPDDHPLSKFADAAFKAAEKRLDQRDRLCDTLSDIRRELRAKPTQLSALEWRCLALADDALEAIANDR